MRRSVENTCPNFSLIFFSPWSGFLTCHGKEKGKKEKPPKKRVLFWVALLRRVFFFSPLLMDILACRSEENSYNILPSAATMLFHGLPGGDVHGVVEEMDRRGKSESAAISSAIDMGESDTVRREISIWPSRLVSLQAGSMAAWRTCDSGCCTLTAPSTSIHFWNAFFYFKFTLKKLSNKMSQLVFF